MASSIKPMNLSMLPKTWTTNNMKRCNCSTSQVYKADYKSKPQYKLAHTESLARSLSKHPRIPIAVITTSLVWKSYSQTMKFLDSFLFPGCLEPLLLCIDGQKERKHKMLSEECSKQNTTNAVKTICQKLTEIIPF